MNAKQVEIKSRQSKLEKYSMKQLQLSLFVVGALGIISTNLSASREPLGIPDIFGSAQAAALLRTAHMLSNVLCV